MELDHGNLHLFDTPEALFDAAARRWVALAREAVDHRGGFHVALSGGSTPKALYERLSRPDLRAAVDWERVHIYFGDERCVPPDHADSNYRMVKESLLQDVSIPAVQIHRMMGESEDLEATADGYAQLLAGRLSPDADGGAGRFDLVMLGMGPDGHVASLFPQTPVLEERHRRVTPVHLPQQSAWRLTITFPVIDAARHIMLLVAGQTKAPVMKEVFDGRRRKPRFPVEMIQPQGEMEWYVDRAAAPELTEVT